MERSGVTLVPTPTRTPGRTARRLRGECAPQGGRSRQCLAGQYCGDDLALPTARLGAGTAHAPSLACDVLPRNSLIVSWPSSLIPLRLTTRATVRTMMRR